MSSRSKTAWYKTKRLTKERGRACEVCGYTGYLELHHIKPVIDGGSNADNNLIILCEKCHAVAHGQKIKKWLDIKRKDWQPGEAHNGR